MSGETPIPTIGMRIALGHSVLTVTNALQPKSGVYRVEVRDSAAKEPYRKWFWWTSLMQAGWRPL